MQDSESDIETEGRNTPVIALNGIDKEGLPQLPRRILSRASVGTIFDEEEDLDKVFNWDSAQLFIDAEGNGPQKPTALYKLGMAYLYGEMDIDRDYEKAMEYLGKAVAAGNVRALFKLGFLLISDRTSSEKDLTTAVDYFFNASKQGHVKAKFNLGLCYYYGIGTKKDRRKAFVQFAKAAEKGSAEGMYEFARCLHRGKGCLPDLHAAFGSYRKAAEWDHPRANYWLGRCYEFGIGTIKCMPDAATAYESAVLLGVPEACFRLGIFFENGIRGVRRDIDKAFQLFSQGASLGNTDCMNHLGAWYERGQPPTCQRNTALAVQHYMMAARKGHTMAMYNLGVCFFLGAYVDVDYPRAFKWLLRAAQKKDTDAMNNVGYLYEHGYIDEGKPDLKLAAKWYRKSADAGNFAAMWNMGRLYADVLPKTSTNLREATIWLDMAARNGDADAMVRLAELYKLGIGVEKNMRKVYALYDTAGMMHNSSGTNGMGECLLKGAGIWRDENKAFHCFMRAAAAGNASAMYNLAGCYWKGTGIYAKPDIAQIWFDNALMTASGIELESDYLQLATGDLEQNSFKSYRDWKAEKTSASAEDTQLNKILRELGDYLTVDIDPARIIKMRNFVGVRKKHIKSVPRLPPPSPVQKAFKKASWRLPHVRKDGKTGKPLVPIKEEVKPIVETHAVLSVRTPKMRKVEDLLEEVDEDH